MSAPSRRVLGLCSAVSLPARDMSRGETVQAKPPNVLVLSASDAGPEKGSEFSAARECLTAYLDSERYVVYPLHLDDVVRTPWKDNCRLLVLPSMRQPDALALRIGFEVSSKGGVPDGVLKELVTYISGGGSLLSLHSATNAVLGFAMPEDLQQPSFVEITTQTASPNDKLENGTANEWVVAQTCASSEVLRNSEEIATENADLPPLPVKKSSKVLARMRKMEIREEKEGDAQTKEVVGETSDLMDCIQHWQFEGLGQVILSHVDLLGSAGKGTNVPELITLKRDAAKVTTVLKMVLEEVGVECSRGESSSPTLSYLVCSDKLRRLFDSAVAPLVKDNVIEGSKVDIELVRTDSATEGSSVDPLPAPATDKIVLLTTPSDLDLEEVEFDFAQYTRWLRTGYLGRTLLYTPVIGSTQTMLTGNTTFSLAMKTNMGVVCAAGQQTQGRGRHSNTWLSPKGCMMFSTPMTIQPQSRLHRRLPLLQHIVALSVVSAVRTIPGYEGLPLCIKWPNDIYYQNRVKLGGILVTSYSGSSSTPTTAIIGCGVNVSNKYPTMSINDGIRLYNATRTSDVALPLLTVEALLALTLNQLERYLSLYEHVGMAAIEADYYRYWLHSNAVVQLGNHGNEEVMVQGIDEHGYMCVLTQSGDHLTLQPDGNSFDIFKNLIVIK